MRSRRAAAAPTRVQAPVSRMSPANSTATRRVLYVVNEDFAFLLNRLPMARAAGGRLRGPRRDQCE